MPLRKSPVRTPALLAANRANSKKSTGPRSPQGKARVALNALQHGRYAVRLRENLVRAGDGSAESQYQWFRSEIAAAFGASGRDEELQAEQMAARAWCTARGARRLGTKPECALESVAKALWYTSLLRIRIDNRRRRIGLVFWVQRHRYWTLERALRVLRGEEPRATAPDGQRLEQRWRRLRFRLRKPSLWERHELEEEIRRQVDRHLAA